MLSKYFSFLVLVLLVGFTSAAAFDNTAYSSFSGVNNYQNFNPSFSNLYSGSDIGTYWPQLADDIANNKCYGNTDFLVMIPPSGCSPSVVRSDLLAEQNVPVFCQLESAKVNPLIKVSSIKSISFKGKYPAEIAGVSYYPSRAALNSYNTLLGSPVVNNIGYVVIILKKQSNETASPKNISGMLTATMYYDAQKAFGVGSTEFYLEYMSDEKWEEDKYLQSFWQGRGLLRLTDVQNNRATVQVLSQHGEVIRTETLNVGQTGNLFYFPGFYCRAGLKLKLNDIDSPQDSVNLAVDGVQMEARQNTKLGNTGCRVTNLNVLAGDTGTVKVVCDGKTVELSLLNMYNANFSTASSGIKTYNLANNVKDNYYLAYAGVTGANVIGGGVSGSEFVVLINSNSVPENKVYSDLATKIYNTFSNLRDTELTLDSFKSKIVPSRVSSKDVVVLFKDSASVSGITFNGLLTSSNELVTTASADQQTKEMASQYFDGGDEALQKLLRDYSAMTNTSGSNFGENGLYEEIELIKQLQQKGLNYGVKKIELMNQFIELYPDSSYAEGIRQELTIAQRTDAKNAYKTVFSNNEYHSIGVVRFEPSDAGDKFFELKVNNINARDESGDTVLNEGDKINLSKITNTASTNDYLIVKKINVNSISLDYYTKRNERSTISEYFSNPTLQFSTDDNKIVEPTKLTSGNRADAYTIYVSDVQVKKTAYVSIVSDLKTSSEANFTYNIGIEQRAIKLSPEKAQEEADELNKTIKEWEDKNAKLGKLVEGWKAVCLSTGLFMQVKNLVTGFSGQSIARQNVMQVYEAKCKSLVPEQYPTIDACYNFYANNISKDVDAYTAAIGKVDAKIKAYDGNLTKFQQNTSACSYYVDSRKVTVTSAQMTSWADARQCLLYQELKDADITPGLKSSVNISTNSQFIVPAEQTVASNKAAGLVTELPKGLQNTFSQYVYSSSSPTTGKISVDAPVVMNSSDLKKLVSNPDVLTALSGADSVGVTTSHVDSKWYLFISKQDKGIYSLRESYSFEIKKDTSQITILQVARPTMNNVQVAFNIVSEGSCDNAYISTPTIMFYDSEPNKGMPAIVPVDSKKGWYAMIPQSAGNNIVINSLSGTSGASQVVAGITGNNPTTANAVLGYTAAGEVNYFWLCNVGPNGLMEQKMGDDICQSFNVNNANYKAFGDECGLSEDRVRLLVKQALANIKYAASQYKNGVRQITLSNVGSANVEPGAVSESSLYQCQDFMSPEDCKIMYNVCDPVICPPSRCNFGGKMPVANVIQSGIIGSSVLCLKNFVAFGGDVYIPVCLTGIHAGIEGYVSILKAQQSCLREYVKSGKHVGICDEMTAIYKCEFFWRQVSPLMQNIIPNLAELAYTGSWNKQASGGEYATFQKSWDNMQKSIDYFKSTYASTSFTAFKFGNVEEIGSTYCRNFLGTSLPTSGKALDALLKPESPAQFYGKFSSILFTGATVPSTSQYKVFYHIYAGTDIGASYSVYLKDPPTMSYYSFSQQVHVKSGYLAKGEQATESVDFTAPTGYKTLCLRVNDQEECGFQSVSTEFTVNALHDLYAQEQGATNNITTENECISGSASVLALANPNIQAGVEEAVNPDISLRGIIRVCASNDPGRSSNPGNWKNVGYCGNKSMTCWLDQSSLKDAQNVLGKVGSISDAIDALSPDSKTAQLTKDEGEVANKLKELEKNITNFGLTASQSIREEFVKVKADDLIAQADSVYSIARFDRQQAEALYLKAQAYYQIVRKILRVGVPNSMKTAPTIEPAPSVPSVISSSSVLEGVVYNSATSVISIDGVASEYTLKKQSGNLWQLKKNNVLVEAVVLDTDFQFEGYHCTFNGVVLSCELGD